MEKYLYTTFGPMSADQLGHVLVHEHIFTETGPMLASAYRNADVKDVIKKMAPLVYEAKTSGITCIFDATPLGVGRRADILKEVSLHCKLPVVIQTGVYREPWIPQEFYSMSKQEISKWMMDELTIGIDDTGVLAGFIKLSATDDGISSCEEKIFRAACKASRKTGAAIGSHTIAGRVAKRQVEIMEEEGVDPSRFVWIHAIAETDFSYHLLLAEKGCFLEYDWANNDKNDTICLEAIQRIKENGYLDKVLISMDSGWYNPRFENGGNINGYTHLSNCFLPKLLAAGFSQVEVNMIMHDNAFSAFSR